MADIIWGSTTKPVAARQLADGLKAIPELGGTLYVGYPILGTPDGAFPFDALLLSPQYGAVAFDIVEGRDIGRFSERQDEIYTKLQAKLLQYPSLVGRRQLAVPIAVLTFAPAITAQQVPAGDSSVVRSALEVQQEVVKLGWAEPERYPALCSAIQALTNVRKGRKRRDIKKADSRGAKLQRINDSIASLDAHQGAAVVETVEGVQRIRGLAGSGKTIVLALKVAYLHAQHPDWRIAVTFNTRSLKGQFERLINTFVIEQTSEEPDWERINIVHSWGSASSSGIYYQFTKENSTSYLDFQSARSRFGESKEFQGVCALALDEVQKPKQIYDAILVDEAQDLPPEFLRLCYEMLKPPRRLVYAYDELQSLTNASLPPPEDIFGATQKGKPLVSFHADVPGQPRQDIILETCYRNPRPILVTAHALGFGVYRKPEGLIQMFEQSKLWLDVGYRVTEGSLTDNSLVRLSRNGDTSPSFLEAHSPIDDLIQFRTFPNRQSQDEWLVSSILTNLREDELSPEDIIVINPEPTKTRKVVASARAKLFEAGVNTSLAGVSGSPDVFFENDVVTFTGIFRAKGNEAAMVYVINADDCYNAFLPAWLTRARNQLFTAITRSKAWVRVLGVGPNMDALLAEYARVKSEEFSLHFTYPDAKRRRELHLVNRDMTSAERSVVSKKVSELAEVMDALDRGDLLPEDLPPDMRARLHQLLGGK
jgi:superfamily I DNA and RNA helicase